MYSTRGTSLYFALKQQTFVAATSTTHIPHSSNASLQVNPEHDRSTKKRCTSGCDSVVELVDADLDVVQVALGQEARLVLGDLEGGLGGLLQFFE